MGKIRVRKETTIGPKSPDSFVLVCPHTAQIDPGVSGAQKVPGHCF